MGRQDYKTDDESDATAVGVAWLLQANLLMQKMRTESLENCLKSILVMSPKGGITIHNINVHIFAGVRWALAHETPATIIKPVKEV